jgi:uncharacterized protein YjbI with pentapeptide repeats
MLVQCFCVLFYVFYIVILTFVFSYLPISVSLATSPISQCNNPAVPTFSVCERVETHWRGMLEKELAGRFKPQLCESTYKEGSQPTPQELANILERHAEWLSVHAGPLGTQEAQRDHRKANLCGADLRNMQLQGVDLRGANLQQAKLPRNLVGIKLESAELWGANLSRSILDNARLIGAGTAFANFCGATMRSAELQPTTETFLVRATMYDTKFFGTLQGVDLCGANLSTINLKGKNILSSFFDGAMLSEIDLSEATLNTVDLSKARLSGVNLRGATLTNVYLTEAFFDLKDKDVEGLQVIGAKGLSSVTFLSPTAMVTLRKFLKDSGLRSEEKTATSALRKFALKTEPVYAQHIAKYVLGGWITDYGADPWWSLSILFIGILPFALVYIAVLKIYEQCGNAGNRPGIWAIWPADRIDKTEGGESVRVTSTFFFPKWQACSFGKWWKGSLRWDCLFLAGLYFSILSAFHIGWRELTVGSWITRFQPREYTLRATGFVRFFSGLQSLLSVYLLALWALTYFGRPFE